MSAARGTSRLRTIARLAWRESRTARRRLLLYMSSISLGVAALVAIDSFASNLTASVRQQSRALLGGDLAFNSRAAFTPRVDSLLDSLHAHGTAVTRVTTFASMALVPRSGGTRLVQVRAVTPGYPFYGTITTEPAGRWETLQNDRNALVDPSLLLSLDARIGDTVNLGYGHFVITGALREVPGDVGVTAAIGPRVFIAAKYLPETQLLVFGSRAQYQALVKLPEGTPPRRIYGPIKPQLDSARVRIETVADTEEDLTRAIEQLGAFLGVVGLIALLLGGIGVASGVHAFVTKKIDTVAVLRCLGATSGQVLAIYVLQAAAMGVLGAAAGALLGVAVQFTLPYALGEFLPVDVSVRLEPLALALGLAVGLWVALVFALRPLLALRGVSPLQALRRDEAAAALRLRWREWPRIAIALATVLSVVTIAILRARNVREGLAMSLAIGAALLVLSIAASLLARGARRLLRRRWPFVVRQGVANLYRPANQTRAVVLALGFGVFLIATIYQVQASLVGQFSLSKAATQANVILFDVQQDQGEGVVAMVRENGWQVVQQAPIVTMRIAEINGKQTRELLADTSRAQWPLRREYRSTYRDTIVGSERIVSGKWFGATTGDSIRGEVSMEQEVARELRLALGDVITWDVQGVRVPTRVTSFREVEWARFEPNFFAVLSSHAVEQAPRNYVILADVPGDTNVARLQRDVVTRYPNVSSLDLSLIQRTVSGILDRVTVAVRFMALLSFALGIPVLFSAVAATRRERLREGVLLKTLGATRAQIGRIMLAEYALLGALGSLTGLVLSIGGAWLLTHFVFESPFVLAIGPALSISLAMMSLAVAIGLLTGRDVFRETPMVALREA